MLQTPQHPLLDVPGDSWQMLPRLINILGLGKDKEYGTWNII